MAVSWRPQRKVVAALLAAAAVAVVSVGNAVVEAYPNNAVVLILAGLIPTVAAYLTKASKEDAVQIVQNQGSDLKDVL